MEEDLLFIFAVVRLSHLPLFTEVLHGPHRRVAAVVGETKILFFDIPSPRHLQFECCSTI